MDILISIALVTRNRPKSLFRTLTALSSQTLKPHEIIVSDDSDGEFSQKVAEICNQFDVTRIIGPKSGLYANRNFAFSQCSGTHVRTMDDDHEFPPDHIEKCIIWVRQFPDQILIISEYYNWEDVGKKELLSPGELNAHGFSSLPNDNSSSWAISDGASIYPTKALAKAGKMNEDFRFGASYLEFGARLHWLGFQCYFVSNLFIIHHIDEVGRSFPEDVEAAASRYFAMIIFSYLYQRNVSNCTTTALAILRNALYRPIFTTKALLRARPAIVKHWQKLSFQTGVNGGKSA